MSPWRHSNPSKQQPLGSSNQGLGVVGDWQVRVRVSRQRLFRGTADHSSPKERASFSSSCNSTGHKQNFCPMTMQFRPSFKELGEFCVSTTECV